MADEQSWVNPIGSGSDRSRRRRAARTAEYGAEETRLAPYEALARMVIARRSRYGFTQSRLAQRMGTSVPAISRLESGQHLPSLTTLERVARAFGERVVVGFEDEEGARDLTTLGR
jgi:ribosome-binding protein aMBF1 (putative translation factor)